MAKLSASDSFAKQIKAFFPNLRRINCKLEPLCESFVRHGVDKLLSISLSGVAISFGTHGKFEMPNGMKLVHRSA